MKIVWNIEHFANGMVWLTDIECLGSAEAPSCWTVLLRDRKVTIVYVVDADIYVMVQGQCECLVSFLLYQNLEIVIRKWFYIFYFIMCDFIVGYFWEAASSEHPCMLRASGGITKLQSDRTARWHWKPRRMLTWL